MIKVPLALRYLLKQDGSRILTADWDIGDGRMIQADKIRARDGAGLALYEDGGKGIFVKDGGSVGIGTSGPAAEVHISGAGHPEVRISSSDSEGGQVVFMGPTYWWVLRNISEDIMFYNGTNRLFIKGNGNIGVGTSSPANPLAVNRQADDGVVIDIEQADAVEGTISVSGNTVSYNAFMGAHFTQLKPGQKLPPVGAIVVATGETIPCESNIEIPVMEQYYNDEMEVPLVDAIKEVEFEEEIDSGKKEEIYVLRAGELIKVTRPKLDKVKIIRKKIDKGCKLDIHSGKIHKEYKHVLGANEEAPKEIEILSRQKIVNGEPVTKTKKMDVEGVERKEYFSYVELASQKADSRVYGVYHTQMSHDSRGQSFGEDDKAVYQIAALGLYKVRVTDTNGNIESGDYIQSSIRAGEGERQDDDILHNYTVAKSIVDVDFSAIVKDPELCYKWQLIPATLHCG